MFGMAKAGRRGAGGVGPTAGTGGGGFLDYNQASG